jgi:hypothetical protein
VWRRCRAARTLRELTVQGSRWTSRGDILEVFGLGWVGSVGWVVRWGWVGLVCEVDVDIVGL